MFQSKQILKIFHFVLKQIPQSQWLAPLKTDSCGRRIISKNINSERREVLNGAMPRALHRPTSWPRAPPLEKTSPPINSHRSMTSWIDQSSQELGASGCMVQMSESSQRMRAVTARLALSWGARIWDNSWWKRSSCSEGKVVRGLWLEQWFGLR